MAIRAGRLRHRIEVQSPTDSQGRMGSVTQTWATDATVWAGIEPISGRERLASDVIQADVTHRIIMRHRALTTENRLLFGARVFNIDAVLDRDERATELEVMVKEEV